MRLEDFLQKYDVKVTSVNTEMCQRPDSVFSKSLFKEKGARCIHETPIKRRLNFAKKVWLESHENYYKLTEETSDYELSKIISKFANGSHASWNMFLSNQLWALKAGHPSVTNPITPKMLWVFWRYSTFLVRRLERLQTQKEDKIYERLPNRDEFEDVYKNRMPVNGRREWIVL